MPFMPETTYNTRAGEVRAACRRQRKSAEDMTIDEICALPKDNLGYHRFKNAIWHAPRSGFSHIRVELAVQEARMLKGLKPLPNTFMQNTKYDAELRGLNFPRHHPDLKSWLEQHGVYTDETSIPIIDQKKLNGPCSWRKFAEKVANYVPPLRSVPPDWAAKLSPQEVAQREQARKAAIEELEEAVLEADDAFTTAQDEDSRSKAQVRLKKARFELRLVRGDDDLMELDG
ncbi:hypothetical protein AC578_10076 [Pseudocercospora eumusae]|nr:hypothetical protein AC578_10076 [Pseudocercospora eumusae]